MDNKKRCLIIDDEDQAAEIERLISIGKKKGLEIECEQFSVGGQKRGDLFDGAKLNKDKVFAAFKAEHKGRFDLIAFDYQLQDAGGITGLDLVGLLGGEKKTSMKVVYSGVLEAILRDILGAYCNDNDFKTARSRIISLYTAGVNGYIERQGKVGYEEVLVDKLLMPVFSPERILVKKLEEYGHMRFQSVFPPFRGKTLAEIAAEIDSANSQHSEKFGVELFEQAIAHMIELNK